MTNIFNYYNEDTYLAHHGVLNMKWGVRKDKDSKKDSKRDPVKEMQRINKANSDYISDLDRSLSSLNESLLNRGNSIIEQYSSMSLEDLYK